MLRSKIYLGYVECKVTGTTARGEHAPIIPQELFDAVQCGENLCHCTKASNIIPKPSARAKKANV